MKVTRSMLGATACMYKSNTYSLSASGPSLGVNITALDKRTFQQGSLNDKDWAVYRIPSV